MASFVVAFVVGFAFPFGKMLLLGVCGAWLELMSHGVKEVNVPGSRSFSSDPQQRSNHLATWQATQQPTIIACRASPVTTLPEICQMGFFLLLYTSPFEPISSLSKKRTGHFGPGSQNSGHPWTSG